MTEYPSILLENAVNSFAKLPGIGSKTALRLVLHLLKGDDQETENFANSLLKLKKEICYCKKCHNISDTEICSICANPKRDATTLCVVENIRDVMSIESTGQYHGFYHVLGGVISPMDGIGPSDLQIASLVERIEPENIQEVIFALPATMEGDTTNFYIFRQIAKFNIKITMLARGVAVGNELEYTDEVTLGRSILNRVEFKN